MAQDPWPRSPSCFCSQVPASTVLTNGVLVVSREALSPPPPGFFWTRDSGESWQSPSYLRGHHMGRGCLEPEWIAQDPTFLFPSEAPVLGLSQKPLAGAPHCSLPIGACFS